ncbi:MtrAB system histidine kinase MtrB [Demequina sp. TMPB413]|uniref:MtrAB system histidine kinase MtrB n=1 Tax=unclassified Demequina TaxID=2620311 RepID=UPI001CF36B41|nr:MULTISPECIES: MtrAB system histidine kinase MtrB [unclassified Demequina]UPU88561.1 MtrAB system histidine kinase MtrB [Demequina sp. TMPB413]
MMLLAPAQKLWLRWTRSMLLRVITSTLVVGLAAVAVLGAYVTSEIRDGLYEKRVERILIESARDFASTEQTFDASTAETPGDLQVLVTDQAAALIQLGGDSRDLVMLRAPQNDSDVFLTLSGEQSLVPIISPELREDVTTGDGQFWQPASLPSGGGPAIVVGASLTLKSAGEYELYFAYSLADEAETLDLIQRVLALGATALVLLVVFMTWTVTLQAVRPVRAAARVAARLADGHLSERMHVKGNDEVATLATTFNDMAASLQRQISRMEDLSRLQRRFVSDVSHELRTPLTTVRMASDVLHEARADFAPAVARSAELLATQLDRFEALLADLLEISRIDAGAAQLDFEDHEVGDVVRDQVETLALAATEQGVELRLWMQEGSHSASMDAPRVGRIIRNLLSNAIEHAQEGPVDIAVASTARTVAVVVRDYGVGLSPSQVKRVFDRFWRGDPARARTMGGTGLGLSIAREDALLHDGVLEASGRPGEGASFRLMLPCGSRGLGLREPLPLEMSEEDFPEVGRRIVLSTEVEL